MCVFARGKEVGLVFFFFFFGVAAMFTSTWRSLAPRPLNRVTLLGAMHEVQRGFLGQSSVFQFTLTCLLFEPPKRDQADKKPIATPPSPTAKGGASQFVKEQYTVRCMGDEAYTEALNNTLEAGCIVRVIGRLKTFEVAEGGKKQLFPTILVEQGRWSHVALLHSLRRQRRDWQLQNALTETRNSK
ncbi:hypothetical protein, conserved [Trypanosoma cruzi]|uniref:Uncharacterized protein n=2 Tax=Trypanosoma cruzi TaxID=5693 RepID=Q4D8F9_TRYCC|nr:hypothetical protein, conserved [Trypanosoma cruzi]EAN88814.1 hypothetical protein, conserved [Trypanosoma cruzi]|eukprot:XP_810665.1 hypothetical protein [Trypanosoma cruzi strain CL Brener]